MSAKLKKKEGDRRFIKNRRRFRTGRPTAIDLFSGCGGRTLGLKHAGFKVIGAVEIDPVAVETYRTNHKDAVVWQTDIRKLSLSRGQEAFLTELE